MSALALFAVCAGGLLAFFGLTLLEPVFRGHGREHLPSAVMAAVGMTMLLLGLGMALPAVLLR